MSEPESHDIQTESGETMELKPGLNAVFAPDLTLHRDSSIVRGNEQLALTSLQAQKKMQHFLDGLNANGGRIVSSLEVEVHDSEGFRENPKPRTMFLVEKAQ